MNKYKVAESIVTKIIADLKQRLGTGQNLKLEDDAVEQEVVDKWEDIVILELDSQTAKG